MSPDKWFLSKKQTQKAPGKKEKGVANAQSMRDEAKVRPSCHLNYHQWTINIVELCLLTLEEAETVESN